MSMSTPMLLTVWHESDVTRSSTVSSVVAPAVDARVDARAGAPVSERARRRAHVPHAPSLGAVVADDEMRRSP